MASILNVDQIDEATTGSGVHIKGHVMQVVPAIKTNVETGSNTSYADVGGLSATITPSSTSSKIMLLVDIHWGCLGSNVIYWRCLRNGSTFFSNSSGGQGAEDGAMWSAWSDVNSFSTPHYQGMRQSFNYLDSPSTTSALTYKIQTRLYSSSLLWRCNQGDTLNDATRITTVSSITLMEIAQ